MTTELCIDEIPWINSHLGIGNYLDYEQMKPILCFSLIWNLFETEACKRNATPKSIRKSVDRANESCGLSKNRYEKFVNYFRERFYLADGKKFDDFFDSLLLTDEDAQKVVQQALAANADNLNNTIYALLLIAHRIRNNLFHGNKDVSSLPQQTELFTTINALLTTYLEDIQNLPRRYRV
ncbi:MAG: hypothetical protein ABSF60_07605 [Verrucomicrobiota bacterium]